MKRYLVLILTVALLLPCLIVPASATGAYDEEINENVSIMSGDLSDLLVFFRYVGDDSPHVLWDSDGDGVLDEWPITEFQEQLIFVYTYCNAWLSDLLYHYFDLYQNKFDNMLGRLGNIYALFNTSNTSVSVKSVIQTTQTVDGITYLIPSIQYTTITTTKFQAAIINRITNPLVDMLYELKLFNRTNNNKTGLDFADDLDPIETQVDEWVDSMETAPTINVDDIETEVDKVTDFETDANYLSVLSGIFLNEAFLMVFSWCVILAMLGFILYGKR